MKKNKYLLLVSSLAVLGLLATAAVEENFFREWRSIQASARSEAGPLAVQLRQIVNPSLKITDRCVSCHVGMAPGEPALFGPAVLRPHKPVVHDPAEYGCTICHGGQGQATEKADAHGRVEFWPEPMLPREMSWAGCGACHVPLAVPGERALREAELAFERLDCYACHRVDGRGGTIRPDGGGMEGPDLSLAALRGFDPGDHRRALALARLMQHARVGMRGGELLRDLRCGIAAVVIDDDHFNGVRLSGHKSIDLRQARRQAARLVVRRDDNGKQRWRVDVRSS